MGASELSKAIVSEIVSDMETSEGRSAAQTFVKGRQGAKRKQIKQRAIEALRSAAAIVDRKAPLEVPTKPNASRRGPCGK
jgi:hypothetical protein